MTTNIYSKLIYSTVFVSSIYCISIVDNELHNQTERLLKMEHDIYTTKEKIKDHIDRQKRQQIENDQLKKYIEKQQIENNQLKNQILILNECNFNIIYSMKNIRENKNLDTKNLIDNLIKLCNNKS